MSAASAGSFQPGVTTVLTPSAGIMSSGGKTVETHQLHHQHHQQQQLQHQQNAHQQVVLQHATGAPSAVMLQHPQHHQQMQMNQNQSIQYHVQQQQPPQQHLPPPNAQLMHHPLQPQQQLAQPQMKYPPARQRFAPRVGNNQQIQLITNGGSVQQNGPGTVRQIQQIQQPLPNQVVASRPLPPPPSKPVVVPTGANLPIGWRRVAVNGEVVYVSPTGENLRSPDQIKDYLLSPGTCKCGLPCPLRPEYFFDFNSQVPNMPLKIPLENGLPSRSLVCLHQRKFFESQHQLQLQKDVKRRRLSTVPKIAPPPPPPPPPQLQPQPQPTHQLQSQSSLPSKSVSVYPNGNVMSTSHKTTTVNACIGGRVRQIQKLQAYPAPTQPTQQQQHQNVVNNGSNNNLTTVYQVQQKPLPQQLQQQHRPNHQPEQQVVTNVAMPNPTWRVQQQEHVEEPVEEPTFTQQIIYNNGGVERVPPIPQQPQEQLIPPTWQQPPPPPDPNVPVRFPKSRTISMQVAKKKPNFKDDPTGYLKQQTQLLHNSIMNVVKTPSNSQGESSQIADKLANEGDSMTTVIQQQPPNQHPTMQIHHPPPPQPHLQQLQLQQQQRITQITQNLYSNVVGETKPEPLFIPRSNHHQTQPPTSQLVNTNPNQIVEYNRTVLAAPRIPSSQQQKHQHLQQQEQNQEPEEVEEEHEEVIEEEQEPEQDDEEPQPALATTSIGGQTVTHFPNGMVQIQQNCDITPTPLKPQQQIQLQQQIQQHNLLFRQNQQIQKTVPPQANKQQQQQIIVSAAQESPVSSSMAFVRTTTADVKRHVTLLDNCKGPAQVGAVSTSIESPHSCVSPAESVESCSSRASSSKTVPSPSQHVTIRTSQGHHLNSQTINRNTITSVTAGKARTATTSANTLQIETPNKITHHSKTLSPNSAMPISQLQLQPINRESGSNQLIMTSTGQIIVMPSSQSQVKSQQQPQSQAQAQHQPHQQQQMIISNGQNSGNVILSPQNIEVLSGHNGTSGGLVIQRSNSNNGQMQSPNNFIVNTSPSGSNIQPTTVILNNGQNIITSAANSNILAANGTKVIANGANILNNQMNLISPNTGGLIGQQTVVLNTLPNGYVLQPNFQTQSSVEDQPMVGQFVKQENGTTAFVQQPQRQIILSSPDAKRRAKKRKSSSSSSSSTPNSLSPQQSPTIQHQSQTLQAQHQQPQVVQIATQQYPPQGFQLSPGIQGIVVNKNAQAPQQQILFQNGQIIQPMNLIGQQLLVPAGLMMAPDTTLVQIQNVGGCGSIITPQGMVLRAQSPQNQKFLSPNTPGQQFIVGSNGQLSPINQIYSTPMGLMMPSQANAGQTATFVQQQNAAIVQQQQQMHQQALQHQQQQQQQQQRKTIATISHPHRSSESLTDSLNHRIVASPPDTTTHSPRSPERPLSQRSGGSDNMVQCVSSSEPDGVVSPQLSDSSVQSPTTTDCDRGVVYQTTHIYKPSEAKIRRVQSPPQFHGSTHEMMMMKPDSHESPTKSPSGLTASPTSTGNCKPVKSPSNGSVATTQQTTPRTQPTSFSVGELVWGAARGHPAWPGKIVKPPGGICTPSDSIWVLWFGGRPNVELVAINSLKSLSDGLEAHHKAQKDTRKSRKLNSQLEQAIQQAMMELDRVSSSNQPTSSTGSSPSKQRGRAKASSQNLGQQRTKPIRIAPAPSVGENSATLSQQVASLTQQQSTK